MKTKTFIGIDPDVDRSGVAIQTKIGREYQKPELLNLDFFDLQERLKSIKESIDSVTVFVEAGYLNKSNWHRKQGGSAAVNAEIGRNVGRNHNTAMMIVGMCRRIGLEVYEIKPVNRKLNASEFKKITGISERTNQETRDAFMLIFGRL